MRLSADYSVKMQLKEEEEAKLKKDISEIALAMNMESIKAKKETYLFDKYEKNFHSYLSYDTNKSLPDYKIFE